MHRRKRESRFDSELISLVEISHNRSILYTHKKKITIVVQIKRNGADERHQMGSITVTLI